MMLGLKNQLVKGHVSDIKDLVCRNRMYLSFTKKQRMKVYIRSRLRFKKWFRNKSRYSALNKWINSLNLPSSCPISQNI